MYLSVADQAELIARGMKHAGIEYSESKSLRASMLVKALALPEGDVDEQLRDSRHSQYGLH